MVSARSEVSLAATHLTNCSPPVFRLRGRRSAGSVVGSPDEEAAGAGIGPGTPVGELAVVVTVGTMLSIDRLDVELLSTYSTPVVCTRDT